jgi:hypothetical protein
MNLYSTQLRPAPDKNVYYVYMFIGELIKPFLVGGTVIAGSKLLAHYTTPAVASLLGGLPTGIITAFFLADKKKTNYFDGYRFHSFILWLSTVLIYYMLADTKYNRNYILAGGLAAWAVISYIILSIVGLT